MTTPSAPVRIHLLLLLLVCFAAGVVGLQQSLPLLPEADEGTWIGSAFQIASTGNLDPGFYGHPGATTLYPLAAAWRLWLGAFQTQEWSATVAQMHFVGRLLSVAYAVLGVLVTARLGAHVWNARVGIAAGWFFAVSPLTVFYAKLLRTDTAATFWGVLALWLTLRLLDAPSMRRQIAAGVAVGLSIASRYFLAVTAFALAAVDLILILHRNREERSASLWWGIAFGMLAIPIAFLVANPALPFHWQQALRDLTSEARVEHLGADGFTPLGNLGFYLTIALPTAFRWPLTLLAFAGAILTALRGSLKARLLLLWLLLFLILISIPALHWDRWIIPGLPVLALFSAAALEWIVLRVASGFRQPQRNALFAAVAALVLALPLWRTVLYDVSLLGQNTRLEARDWMETHLPPGSTVLQETYGAPLEGIDTLESEEVGDLYTFGASQPINGEAQQEAKDAKDALYLVASSYIYERYYSAPDRYPEAIAYYDRLFSEGELIAEFTPDWRSNGPTLRIYRVSEEFE